MRRPVLLLVTLVAASAGAAPARRFIADDYDAARAQALARKIPIFVEVWAPW